MAKLQKEFNSFHEIIKLKQYQENTDLRKKRDMLFSELRDGLKDEKIPGTDKKLTFREINQGSYAMNTGVKPKNDDYDIDIGAIFNVTNNEYDSDQLKKLVRDKLQKANRTVTYNRPCITVEYKTEDYHVDLAVYSDNDENIHIAWGKEFSSEKVWYKSEPEELTQWVADVSTNSDVAAQFRHCVRYLKKWKEKHFNSGGNGAPSSIGLTIQARNVFRGIYSVKDDLDILILVVSYIKNEFSYCTDPATNEQKRGISVNLPVQPYKNVYYKMSLNQQNTFYEKTDALLEALHAVRDESSDHIASKILRGVFGDEFPLVEDIKKLESAPYVITGNSA